MSHRDLTYNSPLTRNRRNMEGGSSEESSAANPFISHESSSSVSNQQSYSGKSDDYNQMQNHINPDDTRDETQTYGQRFSYNEPYANATHSNLIFNQGSSEDTQGLLSSRHAMGFNGVADTPYARTPSPNNIHIPPEYDRYPSMTRSRVVSSTSISSQLKNDQYEKMGGQNSEEKILSKLANPFSTYTDLSPFGGYPASSFPLHIDEKEPDDYIHNPDPIADASYDKNRFWYDLKNMDRRSCGGFFGFIFLLVAAVVVFIILPVLTYSGITTPYHPQTYELLTAYSYPILSGIRSDLVDPDTPSDALKFKSTKGETWKLVFSDEFNAEGRTFYKEDDQFFEAVDLYYASTQDLEWYDPDAVSTANGTLNIRMDAYKNHDLFYRSGMVQSWNKMCFSQGKVEFSARLPNYGNKHGLWPGLWTLGNLGRPGFMASTEGVWPYTYESCDAGITPNQSSPDGISYLPGQKLNSCTCKGEDHPNPGVGRGAPEVDAIEGTVADVKGSTPIGVASQSLQIAPYDIWYMPDYNFIEIYNASVTSMNTWAGGPLQQGISGATTLNLTWYEFGEGSHNFQRYGVEFLSDNDKGYLTWYIGEEKTYTLHAYALAPNGNIGWRRISKEPMSVIMNMGLSNSWDYIDWPSINFPVELRVDYVRVYQASDNVSITCDPTDHPTYQYIESHLDAYQNPNYTSWTDAGYKWPKNKLMNKC
ncbi:Piso0_000686 [Millerozyma farinosa CBS 7064]|uniref:Piso0_000686 protein n=1 Tax=Pichia sorbitophila (strain ATCC MYA-4447 / BCRC 22081 / CBS 7064 / NBRC 10061 / NRRL Y-12695) TaxID=559304 RepID=G8YR86_PICSO|nr:Piso0_000686 [Millerozyma farinosa CBS 7064]